MRGVRVLRSGAFRFALLFAGVFAIASMLLLLIVERSIADYAFEATAGSLEREARVLRSDDRSAGRAELLRAIGRRSHGGDDQPFRYLLVDRVGHRLAGDLPETIATPGWSTVRLTESERLAEEKPATEVLKTYGVRLADGAVLVIATDTYDVQELRRNLEIFTILSGLAVTALALVGGWLVGGIFLRRLDRVNDAAEKIMAGNLAERLPTIGMGPEFDHLAQNLNRMLDRIGALIDGLRQVSTDIAHDLRTPLTRLRQQLEALQGVESAASYEAGIDDAIAQTDEILRVFRASMRIATIEGGQGRQRFARVDLGDVMDRVAQAYRPVAEDEGKIFESHIAPGIFIMGDGELLAQLFTNLVENAINHTLPGTRIVMSLVPTDDRAVATVADDGAGIPEAERQNVLKRFYRLDASRATTGAGLGLALVAAIAQLHEAELRIGDARPGLIVSVVFQHDLRMVLA
jgi:signal transduction histidine kinase